MMFGVISNPMIRSASRSGASSSATVSSAFGSEKSQVQVVWSRFQAFRSATAMSFRGTPFSSSEKRRTVWPKRVSGGPGSAWSRGPVDSSRSGNRKTDERNTSCTVMILMSSAR
jgi:hypothetical protein